MNNIYGKNALKPVREDDYVEYYLFPNQVVPDPLEDEERLTKLKQRVMHFLDKYTNKYLWHKDSFQLNVRTAIYSKLANLTDGASENLPSHLHGVTHFGENIEDEWFIVFLLLEASKEFNDLVIRVADADGEFLLIEAAEFLPKWCRPEVCENRVYLHNGHVHIVAPEDTNEEEEIVMKEAVTEVRNCPSITVASREVQKQIKSRISQYPKAIKENTHIAMCVVPAKVAAILKHKPGLISHATVAYCNRDSIDTKTLKLMRFFPPEDMVNHDVTFTRHLYAMLVHAKFKDVTPDKKMNVPVDPSDDNYKVTSLGAKITCGLEILASRYKPDDTLECDRGWFIFLNTLKETNYFKGLLEGSKEYTELMGKAKAHFLEHRESMNIASQYAKEVYDLATTFQYDLSEIMENQAYMNNKCDESWLNISQQNLDEMLNERYGRTKHLYFNKNSEAVNFTEKVYNFLQHVSSVDGAEFPPEDEILPKADDNVLEAKKSNSENVDSSKHENVDAPLRPPRKTKKSSQGGVSFNLDKQKSGSKNKATAAEVSENKVDFDSNAFYRKVEDILNFAIPEDDSWNLESDSDMSDYGKEEMFDDTCDLKIKMKEYMEEMDRQLAETTIGESFEKVNTSCDDFDDVENFKPVDIDMNALKNIMASYKAQMGEAGPSSNMLGPMGVHLETDDD